MGGGRSSFHLPTKREKKKEKSGKERREGRGGREGLSDGGRNVSPPDSFSGGTRAPSRTVFFCVDGSPRQDFYSGQSQEAEDHHCG